MKALVVGVLFIGGMLASSCSFAQSVAEETGLVSGQISESMACRNLGGCFKPAGGDRQNDDGGFGFFTRITVQNGVITKAISGVCEHSCDAAGSVPSVATWLMERVPATPGTSTPIVQMTMTLNASIPVPIQIVAGAAPSIVQYMSSSEAAEQYSSAVKEYTQHQQEQERQGVRQFKSSVATFTSQSTRLQLDSLSSIAIALDSISSASRVAATKFAEYNSLTASPFVTKELQYDAVTAKYALEDIRSRLKSGDYQGVSRVADELYNSNYRDALAGIAPAFVSDGLFHPEAVDSTLPASVFDGTRFSTGESAGGGQALRRMANSFGAFWAESRGITNYTGLSVNEYLTGVVLLRQADESLAHGDETIGLGYLQASAVMLDVARGIRAGVVDSIQEVVEAVPILAKTFLKFEQVLFFGSPSEQFMAIYDIVLSVPTVARSLVRSLRADVQTILYGSTAERAEKISKLATDVVIAGATGAIVEGVTVGTVVVSESTVVEETASGLGEVVERADKAIPENVTARAEVAEPLVAEARLQSALGLDTNVGADAGDQIVQKITAHAVSGHAEHWEALGLSSDDEVRAFIKETIVTATGNNIKHLSSGATAFWNEEKGVIVIYTPTAVDKGTAFRTSQRFFDGLK